MNPGFSWRSWKSPNRNGHKILCITDFQKKAILDQFHANRNLLDYNTAMVEKPFFVRAEWDDEASVWVATSDDVPGLATESENLDQLMDKLKIMIPELLELNGISLKKEVPFEVITRRFEIAPVQIV